MDNIGIYLKGAVNASKFEEMAEDRKRNKSETKCSTDKLGSFSDKQNDLLYYMEPNCQCPIVAVPEYTSV